MKKFKKYLGLLLCFLLVAPTIILAEEEPIKEPIEVENRFVVEADDEVTSKKDVNGSGGYFGNNVTFDKTMDGIGLFAGNNVNYKGNSEYAVLAGNTITLDGEITKDGAIFGNLIDFKEEFVSHRDLVVFGSSVTLKGNFERDLLITADTVVIENTSIKGNIKVMAGTIEVKETATIAGTLTYNEDAEVTIANNATIGNTVISEKIAQSTQEIIWTYFLDYAGILFVFLVLALLVPSLFKRIDNKVEKAGASSIVAMLGYGALGLIGIPIAIVLLFMIPFGGLLGFIAIALYIILACLTTMFTGYLLGLFIWKQWIKKEKNTLLIGLLGISILCILLFIPYINNILSVVSVLFGFGLILTLFKKD